MGDMIPAEKLAAFIDGRLNDDERAEVLAALARSEDDREVLASAVAALDDGRDAAAPASGVGTGPIRWKRWTIPAAAAATAAIFAVGMLRNAGDPADALLEALGDAPPALIQPREPGWSNVRGEAQPEPVILFRIGVRLVDLPVAERLGDRAGANRIAGELAALLDQVGGGSLLARSIESIADGVRAGGDVVAADVEAIRTALDGPVLRVGHALETARWAARVSGASIARKALRDALDDAEAAGPPLRATDLGDRISALTGLSDSALADGTAELIRALGN